MKLFAQMGHGVSDKASLGLKEKSISGIIYSAKDIDKSQIAASLYELKTNNKDAEFYLDPQFYTTLHENNPNLNLGKINTWEYFKHYQKSSLESEKKIEQILKEFFTEIKDSNIDFTGIISPNIYISQLFDSREAVISKNFIRAAKKVAVENGEKRPVFASLVISREALLDQSEFEIFINDITQMNFPPDGIYLIIGGSDSEFQNSLLHADVLSNWMVLNYSLSINGLKVINGYSDIFSPLLIMAGGYAGATGWWSNLRTFTINKFFPSLKGGRQPLLRYLSLNLLNRITIDEYNAIKNIINNFPNLLEHDIDYEKEGDRTIEALQTWETLSYLIEDIEGKSLSDNLDGFYKRIINASSYYAEINGYGILLDKKSQDYHLEVFKETIAEFKKVIELS